MKSVREGMSGPEAFVRLITTFNHEFDSGDCGTSLICIRSFAVPTETPFKMYLPEYERLETDMMHGDTRYLPRQNTVIDAVMDNVWTRYPAVLVIAFRKPLRFF